jgi:hypothetical protein
MNRPRGLLPRAFALSWTIPVAISLLGGVVPLEGRYLKPAIDTVGLPLPVAFPLARSFLSDIEDDCMRVPGSIVSFTGDTLCTHPLENYVFERSDSVVIRSGGCVMLAAYRAFGSVRQNKQPYSFSHKQFLAYAEPPPPEKESWISRQLTKLLSWTFMQFFNFLLPRLAELWNGMSSQGKTVFAVVASLLLLVFLVAAARALSRSHFVQLRLAPDTLPPIKSVRRIDWLARADASLKAGRHSEALSFLYAWFTVWLTEARIVTRQEWWTNRQLVTAVKRARPAIHGLAQSLVAVYEDAEYGHRAVDAASVSRIRNRIQLELLGGRP